MQVIDTSWCVSNYTWNRRQKFISSLKVCDDFTFWWTWLWVWTSFVASGQKPTFRWHDLAWFHAFAVVWMINSGILGYYPARCVYRPAFRNTCWFPQDGATCVPKRRPINITRHVITPKTKLTILRLHMQGRGGGEVTVVGPWKHNT